MSLIKCPECKKTISNEAVTCPNCGYPIHSSAPNQPPQQGTSQTPVKQKKKGHGCLVTILVVFILLGASIAFGVSRMATNPEQYAKKSTLAKTMNLNSTQEANMLKIFESCSIGEITSASVFQESEDHTSYYLEDKETEFYKGAEYAIVVWVDNASKTIESIHFHDQDIFLNGNVLSPITDYYVNSTDRDKYRVSAQLAIKELLNYPDTAKFPAISGWAFGIEDGTIIVQSTVTAKNAFDVESTSAFQVKFESGNITSLIMDGTEYVK